MGNCLTNQLSLERTAHHCENVHKGATSRGHVRTIRAEGQDPETDSNLRSGFVKQKISRAISRQKQKMALKHDVPESIWRLNSSEFYSFARNQKLQDLIFKDGEEVIKVFVTDIGLLELKRCRIALADGTFKISRGCAFGQMFTLYTLLEVHGHKFCFPAIYLFLKTKEKSIYKRVFKIIDRLTEGSFRTVIHLINFEFFHLAVSTLNIEYFCKTVFISLYDVKNDAE